MSKTHETFSAFIDAELTTAEMNEQISDASTDVNKRYRMQRYQFIGDMMRGEASALPSLGFAAQISAEIEKLEPLSKPVPVITETESASFFSQWFKPLSGLAIAASVAWVAVVSLQSTLNVDTLNGEFTQKADEYAQVAPQTGVTEQVNRLAQLPIAANVLSVSAPILMRKQGQSQWSTDQSQELSQAKLNAYLVTHTEYSTSMQGIMPQARVAGFDVNP